MGCESASPRVRESAKARRRGDRGDRGARGAVADSVLDRQLQVDASNQKRVNEFTYIWTAEGWL